MAEANLDLIDFEFDSLTHDYLSNYIPQLDITPLLHRKEPCSTFYKAKIGGTSQLYATVNGQRSFLSFFKARPECEHRSSCPARRVPHPVAIVPNFLGYLLSNHNLR